MRRQKYKPKLEEGCPYQNTYGCSFRTFQRYSQLGYPLDTEEGTRALIAGQRSAPPGQPAQIDTATDDDTGKTPRQTGYEPVQFRAALFREAVRQYML